MTLATRYLGLQLAHPIVASASPLTATFDGMRRLEDAGAAAVVMSSLYEEQIRAEDTAYTRFTEHGSFSQAETGSYFPELPDYDSGVSGHLETLRRATESLRIPVIASLNGTTAQGWVEHAKRLEQAGAAALELNVYSIPIDPDVSGAAVEQQYIDIVREVQIHRTHSDFRQARAVFHRRFRTWRQGWFAPASTALCCSIASMRRTSISRRCA